MSFPRPTPEARAFFSLVLPGDPHIQIRPMFGNWGAFINGNMFAGLFGDDLFVRLPETERRELLDTEGTSPFAPMPERPMREYVVLPAAWKQEPERISAWLQRSFDWAETLPVKLPPKKKADTPPRRP
ncbi:TfoX/Sxy family protein [Gorillibacterium sp. sgz5001074]|uniref:TfoX/Sxy family protein n=1 Tax=Gorillibacterium sp. sgz5001074 TaxID=3446695 RepID=UPI003F6784BD